MNCKFEWTLLYFLVDFLIYFRYNRGGGGGQNLGRWNVERSIFRNFKIANIKIMKDELFDSFIIEFFVFNFL